MTNNFGTNRTPPPPIQFWVQRYRGYGYPPNFRAPHGRMRQQVRGGRWSVRKTIDGRWKAWTKGEAKRHNRRFNTHAEALEWATTVAWVFKTWRRPASDAYWRDEILKDMRRRGVEEVLRELPNTLY